MDSSNIQICLECDECRMIIPGEKTVFRQFDRTFCSENCRDCSTASLDHLYSRRAWPGAMCQLETKRPERLLRTTSSKSSVCSLGRVPTVNVFSNFTEEPVLQKSAATIEDFKR